VGLPVSVLFLVDHRGLTLISASTNLTNQAVPLSPWVAEPRMEEKRNWPQMNTDEHG
jgi:hypothetical protein